MSDPISDRDLELFRAMHTCPKLHAGGCQRCSMADRIEQLRADLETSLATQTRLRAKLEEWVAKFERGVRA
jgi:hypothetical protein